MCGIVGYIGKQQAQPILLDGLSRLEYRGYDSAGIAIMENGQISLSKAKGRVKNLMDRVANAPLTGCIGIGHTRWATHGVPSEVMRTRIPMRKTPLRSCTTASSKTTSRSKRS